MQHLQVTIVEELGRGTSGIVFKVRHQVTGKFYVVKTIDFSNISEKKQTQSLKEVDLLKQVKHTHVIKYYDSIVQNKVLHILMEYAAGGDLQKKINRYKLAKRYLEEGQIWTWAYEIALGLKYLHRHKILHRDVKCMNIFLDKNNRVKIGDLGLSKILHNNEIDTAAVGTPLYLSPEQIRHQPYGFKVDVWGMGCVIYALCTFESPFFGNSLLTLGQNIALKDPKPIPAKYSPRLVNFVSHLLEKNPKNRPNIKGALEIIPIFTKKTYKLPPPADENIFIESELDVKNKPNSSSDSIFPKCFSSGLEKSMQANLKQPLVSESRPMTQATKRLLVASSDTVRISTAYVKHRYIKCEKPKMTISDLAMLK